MGIAIEICKQDQQVAALAGGLWQAELEVGIRFSVKAINRLLLALSN